MSLRKFRVGPKLRRGYHGSVHVGWELLPEGRQRPVELEVPHQPLAGDTLTRVRMAVALSERLTHAGIVRSSPPVKLEGRWTLVRDRVDGVDLATLLELGTIPPGAALDVAASLADALDAWARVQDGTGPLGGDRHFAPGDVLVTPAGTVHAVDVGAGDVWLLGALLFRMLTGRVLEDRRSLGPDAQVALRKEAADAVWDVIPDLELSDFQAELLLGPRERPKAAEVAARCRKIREDLGLGGLAEWAARAVPPVLEETTRAVETAPGPVKTEDADAPSRDLPMRSLSPWETRPAYDGARFAGEDADEDVDDEDTDEPTDKFAPRRRTSQNDEATEHDRKVPGAVLVEPTAPPAAAAADRRALVLGVVGGGAVALLIGVAVLFGWPTGSANVAPAQAATTGAVPTTPPTTSSTTTTSAGTTSAGTATTSSSGTTSAGTTSEGTATTSSSGATSSGTSEAAPSTATTASSADAPKPTTTTSTVTPTTSETPKTTPETPKATSDTIQATSETPKTPTSSTTAATSSTSPAPTKPSTGKVDVTGDAHAVALVSGSSRMTVPGSVPAGHYTVEATFDGDPLVAGEVDVSAGGSVTLSCSSLFTRCAPR